MRSIIIALFLLFAPMAWADSTTSSRVYDAPFDRVYFALIETLGDQGYRIDDTDKAGGFVRASMEHVPRGNKTTWVLLGVKEVFINSVQASIIPVSESQTKLTITAQTQRRVDAMLSPSSYQDKRCRVDLNALYSGVARSLSNHPENKITTQGPDQAEPLYNP